MKVSQEFLTPGTWIMTERLQWTRYEINRIQEFTHIRWLLSFFTFLGLSNFLTMVNGTSRWSLKLYLTVVRTLNVAIGCMLMYIHVGRHTRGDRSLRSLEKWWGRWEWKYKKYNCDDKCLHTFLHCSNIWYFIYSFEFITFFGYITNSHCNLLPVAW